VKASLRSRTAAQRPRKQQYGSDTRFRRRRLIAAGVVAGCLLTAAAVALLFFSGLANVERAVVTGTTTVSVDNVLAAAAVPVGKPLAAVDTDAIAARVAAVPGVAAAEVGRGWPHTLEIAVTERVAAAVGKGPRGPVLVDPAGVPFLPAPPDVALPRLLNGTVGPDDPATRAALAVLAALPQPLRDQVLTVGVVTGGSEQVTLGLTEDRMVRWGSLDRAEEKAAVLGPLLTEPGEVYDVSSPELPTVRR
jgi:cell division protein FtsQ